MGKSVKPLALLCHPTIYQWEELQTLKTQGHTVDSYDSPTLGLSQYDLVLGPNAWYFDTQHRPYLEIAIKTARKTRYGQKGGS